MLTDIVINIKTSHLTFDQPQFFHPRCDLVKAADIVQVSSRVFFSLDIHSGDINIFSKPAGSHFVEGIPPSQLNNFIDNGDQ
jgi:hypothetical protein